MSALVLILGRLKMRKTRLKVNQGKGWVPPGGVSDIDGKRLFRLGVLRRAGLPECRPPLVCTSPCVQFSSPLTGTSGSSTLRLRIQRNGETRAA
jgi:hypothetical protein